MLHNKELANNLIIRNGTVYISFEDVATLIRVDAESFKGVCGTTSNAISTLADWFQSTGNQLLAEHGGTT